MDVFRNRGHCADCHEGINFTANAYHNLGVGMNQPDPDVSRYAVTRDDAGWGRFKVPTLRDISRRARYMHDGSLATLDEVVELYDKGGPPIRNRIPGSSSSI